MPAQRLLRMKRWSRAVLGLSVSLSLAACERIMQDMYQQPRDKAYRGNTFFDDGKSAREPLPDTVAHARGGDADASSGRRGRSRVEKENTASRQQALSYPLDHEQMTRGRERYNIYCMPCHSAVGDGDGRVVRRGFPAPPSYHIKRLREATDRHFYDVISDGYGVMHAYGDRIDPTDRWAIVAYIRALQRSQYAHVDALPDSIARQAVEQLNHGNERGASP